jgi:hypothetical protein
MTVEYSPGVDLVEWACEVARSNLAEALPRRWSHVEGVIRFAREIAGAYGEDGDLLIAAAALHDVGWAPPHVRSGFPALDAARYLSTLNTPRRLLNLAVNYDASQLEAELRGLGSQMKEFPDEGGPVRDALWYCDLRVGPDGQRMPLAARLAEVRVRYAHDPIGVQWVDVAEADLLALGERTERFLERAGIPIR